MNDFENNDTTEQNGREAALSDQSEAILKLLADRGLLQDVSIGDEQARKAQKDKRRSLYHNTRLMLRYYRDISWALECFPADVAGELDRPMSSLDAILGLINAEIGMGNQRLEGRILSVQKSRLLLDRFNEALTVLRQKPGNGEIMYQLVYLTYIAPEDLSQTEILYRLNISTRHYYRLRQQAVNIISIRLWATPMGELDAWLDILALLESL